MGKMNDTYIVKIFLILLAGQTGFARLEPVRQRRG
jgi:hypothetical protein